MYMIYSRKIGQHIPVNVTSENHRIKGYGSFIRYTIKDNRIPVGYVDLQDTKNGVYVCYIKNLNPDLYSGVGKLADQIEVEHCLKNNKKNPYIESTAQVGTLLQHFKRGKRFIDEGVNVFLNEVLKNLQKGERVYVGFLGNAKMFMPQNLIQKCMEQIEKHPLLK